MAAGAPDPREVVDASGDEDERQVEERDGDAAATTPTGIGGPPMGFLSGLMPERDAAAAAVAPPLRGAPPSKAPTPPRTDLPDLSGQPSFTTVPLMTGAFMPPPAVLKEIADRGNAFSFYLTYMGVTSTAGLIFLEALDLPVNEHFVSFLGIRDDEIEEIFDTAPKEKRYTISLKSKIRMAFKVIRAMGGVEASRRSFM